MGITSPGAQRIAEPIRVAVHDQATGPDWDRFVRESPDGSICHLSAWREILENVLGHECLYTVALDPDDACRGILPLVRVKSALFGHYLISMPFLNQGGPLGTAAARTALEDFAVDEARRSRADLLELRYRHAAPSALTRTDRKLTVLLPLPQNPDDLWKTFPAKLRSQIKRPLRERPEVRFGRQECEPFYEVFSRHMRDLGTPVLPRQFFERVGDLFGGAVVFGTVRIDGRLAAAGCGFLWENSFEMTWASALREFRRSAPNMLLYYSFMQEMVNRGVSVFDFGRCTPGGGTHRFKLQWGGSDYPLPWIQWSARQLAAPPTPETPVYRMAAGVWKRLPLAVANAAGPRLARLIP